MTCRYFIENYEKIKENNNIAMGGHTTYMGLDRPPIEGSSDLFTFIIPTERKRRRRRRNIFNSIQSRV